MEDAKNKRRFRMNEEALVNVYMAEVGRIPIVSAEEERDLLAKAKAGDRAALNKLVSANLRFVVAVCWNYRNRGLPMPDLINEGNLALFRAAENFNTISTVRFMSYAVWWIRQSVLSAIARQAGAITLPPDRLQKIIRFRRAASRLTQKLGREPCFEEMEAELGGTGNTWTTIAHAAEGITSFGGARREERMELLAAPENGDSPDTDADIYLIRKALRTRLGQLNGRQRQILALRYGLGHGMMHSLNEVGALLSISRERVRQIEEHALAQLRLSSRVPKAGDSAPVGKAVSPESQAERMRMPPSGGSHENRNRI